jgi:hypothetical protein
VHYDPRVVCTPTRRAVSSLLALLAASVAACGASSPTTGTTAATAAASPTTTTTGTSIPLGDNHHGTTPRSGYIDSCTTTFGGGGASSNGPWITGNTWDPSAKLHVQGDVAWPAASYTVTVSGTRRTITTEDLPVGHRSGVFPIASTDPASQYDQNPNAIAAHHTVITVDVTPAAAAQPSCLGLGAIGVLTDGVLLFNGLDAGGRDAAAHEVLDSCDGHPAPGGTYHHHTVPSCLLSAATGATTLVGYALDGFGIYVERDTAGKLLTDSDLDACHGRTSTVPWDGAQVAMYHYVATAEFPYTLGCYHGTAERAS